MKQIFYSLLVADFILALIIFSAVTTSPVQADEPTPTTTWPAVFVFTRQPFAQAERPAKHERSFAPVLNREQEPAYHPVRWWDEGYRAVQRDLTNEHPYIVGEYGCEQFSLDLVTNLRALGIYAYRVAVKFNGTDYGHMFVAIPTTDLGTIYIEPQDDFQLEPPRVGDQFCYNLRLYNSPPACNPSLIITKVVVYP